MSFVSPLYILFFPAVYIAWLLVGERHRWMLLLAASIAFYAALKAPHLLAALALVSAISYVAGTAIDRSGEERVKGWWLGGGVVANLLVLVTLRYLPFLTGQLDALLGAVGAGIAVPLAPPLATIGVSYFVFQAISYLVDVYTEVEKPERHPGYLALYLAFFPKLLQGPIERAGDLLPQLRARYAFEYESARAGLLLFGWGLFKKVIVADHLGMYADTVYGDVRAFEGVPLVLATYFYAGQLYYDFSGYTDMALGTARLFGIRLTQNFNRPYGATSIVEFWRRWHISFSRWILDYIFKPLQMQFRGWKNLGAPLALVLTFLACGVWHGATWTFVAWGALHGLYMAASVLTARARQGLRERWRVHPAVRRVLGAVFTFHLVCFAWIFFRADTVAEALYVAGHLLSGGVAEGARLLLAHGKVQLLISLAAVALVELASRRDGEAIAGEPFRRRPVLVRWVAYCALVLSILYLGEGDRSGFLYFKF